MLARALARLCPPRCARSLPSRPAHHHPYVRPYTPHTCVYVQYTKAYIDATVPEMAFGEYWDSCEYTDGVLNYNQDAHRQASRRGFFFGGGFKGGLRVWWGLGGLF